MLQIVGNIARVRSVYPDGRRYSFIGGAATHIALAASGFGGTCSVVSVLGTDLTCALHALRDRHVAIDKVAVVDGHSCTFGLTYTAMNDISSVEADFGVSEQLTDHALATIADASRLHVCCRRPLDASQLVPLLRGQSYSVDFFLPSIEPNVHALQPVIYEAEAVFVNAAEFTALKDLIEVSQLRLAVVTDGPRPAVVIRQGTVVANVRPPVVQPVEVSGAGDTVIGVFLVAQAAGSSDHDALDAAVRAASRSLTTVDLPIR
jgi:sugar/nucleoside kinase (ribokinase family)